ncbi:MAG: hypothetical protein HY905_06160 [Deltaproteobacteria bacterium]|nr:hypothetical protein [Deltaproteobacteria bacterium]
MSSGTALAAAVFLFAAPETGRPTPEDPPGPAGGTTCVIADDPAGQALLVDGLRARGLAVQGCQPATWATWTVRVEFLAPGPPAAFVRAADGTTWKPVVVVDDAASLEDRARSVAVAVAAVLELLLEGEEPLIPAEPVIVVSPPPEPAPPAAPPEEPAPPPPPPDVASPATEGAGEPVWSAALLLAATGNLEVGATRLGTAGVLGVRLDVAFPAGIWLALDFDWTVTGRERAQTLLLETATPRLVAGAVLGPGPWNVRFGLGWAFQGWWTEGGTAPRQWRTGGTLLVEPSWQPSDGIRIGADFAVDLYRTRVEIDYGAEPIFALDQWRWRAGLWAAFRFAGG